MQVEAKRLVNHWHVQTGQGWACYHGHALIVLRGFEPESFDFVLTDPPYGTGANSVAGRSLKRSGLAYSDKAYVDFVDNFLPEGWRWMMMGVFTELFRVLREGGHVLVFSDWRALAATIGVVNACGFVPLSVAVWDKGRATRPMPDQFRRQAEFILHAVKGKPKQNPKPKFLDGVIHVPTLQTTDKLHAVQKPVELLAYLLQLAPEGSHVLDPFQGVGSTGVACLKMGLRYTGIELIEDFHRIACERLKAAENQKTLWRYKHAEHNP